GRERIMRLPALLAIIVPLAACAASRTLERPAPPAAAVAPRGDANAGSPPPRGRPPRPRPPPPPPPPAPPAPPPAPPAPPAPPPDPVSAAPVRPILASRCTPCHEKGGRMYERLPFDDGSVVASHAESVVRRLKEPKEREAVEAWLARRALPR